MVTDYVAVTWARCAGTSPQAVEARDRLVARYREPHRRYHGVAHLEAVMKRMLDAPIFRPGSSKETAARANIEYELQELANGHILG